MTNFSRLLLLLTLLFTFSAAGTARADVAATVYGTVADSKGARLPGASVILTNSKTGFVRQLTADGSGNYEFLSVPVGDGYTVEVSSSGFQKFKKAGITLQVNQSFRVDFVLKVGEVSQEVSVSADTVQVDTSSNQIGDLITDKKMTALPLNGRSYTDLLGLQPGVVPITSSAAFTDRPVSGGLNAGGVSVNGSRESGNAFLINGGDVQEPKNSGASVIPNLDAIQEFRVLTSTFDAEYGRFAGAIVNVITKSGTNEFHGSAFEFLRNEKLNAKNYFDQNRSDPSTGLPIPNTARGVFKRNQFGGTFGGPIFKNKMFFFSDYQGTREVRGLSSSPAFIPSQAEVGGSFADVGTTGYGNITSVVKGDNIAGNHTLDEVLSQRLGYLVRSGEPYWVAGCNTNADALAGVCVFPSQQIPKAALDTAAVGTLQFVPSPSGVRGGSPFFATTSLKNQLTDDKIGERLTFTNKRTGDWSLYFSGDRASTFDPFAGGNVPGFAGTVPQKAYQANVSNTHIFGASMVNEARINYTRSTIFQTHPSGSGLGPVGSFGFKTTGLGLIAAVPEVEGVPSVSIGGAYSLNLGVVSTAINQVNNTYQLADVFSKVVGRHSLKFGGEVRKLQVNEFNISFPNGSYGFDGSETGNAFADYLIGAPSGFTQQSYSTFFTRANYGGVFVQDAFRIKNNVTINAGLRYELIQPWYEKEGRLNAIIWGQQSTVYPGSPTGWVFPGDSGISKTIAPTPKDDFSPRLGVVWAPDAQGGFLGKLFGGAGKTSIRAGSGLYFQAIEDQPSFYTIGDAPFGLYYSSPTQVYFSEPYKDRRHGNDPGQHFPFTDPKPGQAVDWSTYLPIGGSPGVLPNNKTPTVLQFNTTIQREFARSTIFSIGYVGTRGHHLLSESETNPGDAALCLAVAAALPAGQGCGPHGEDQIYNLPGRTVYGTRPHSITSGTYKNQGLLDFTSNAYNGTFGDSDYNALQMSLNKSFGFAQFLASYTFSKSIDDTSGPTEQVNPFNHRLSRSLSAFDLPQNFVVSYSFDLPKLRGQNLLVRGPLGGWSLSGITRLTSGLPVTISERLDRNLWGSSGTELPNWDGKAVVKFDPRASSAHTYFSAAQFPLQAIGTNGNSSRRFFHGPGINNTDVALRKFVEFESRFSLEFRAEFFNLFNHAQFKNPASRVGSSSFGRISGARDPRIGQVALRLTF